MKTSSLFVLFSTLLSTQLTLANSSTIGDHPGLIHWLRDDPRRDRPDGYVYFSGVVCGDQ